jgi:hypothetical protein
MAAKMQNKKIAGRFALGAIIATVALILLVNSNQDQAS